MSFGRLTALSIASVIGMALMVTSAAVLVARLAPETGFSAGVSMGLPIAEPHRFAAEAAGVGRRLGMAQAESLAELNVSPMNEDAWLRLAQIDALQRTNHLGPKGLASLSRAYDVRPYDLSLSSPRRNFVLHHRGELSGDLRAQVDQELSSTQRPSPQAKREPSL